MPFWAIALLAVGAAVLLVPLVALAGRGLGRKARGNLALAGILLGFGEPFDPPQRRLAEASHKDEEAEEAAGDPTTPET
jgi:hypothetical protein